MTSHIDRRLLLVAAMATYVAGHVLSALTANYDTLLAARLLIAIGAAIYTPQAAATIGALLPPERRSEAITFAFIGWSLASVGGLPMGGFWSHYLGVPAAFAIVAVSASAAMAATWFTVPAGVRIEPLNMASWREVFTSPALLLVLASTILNGTGQFTFFTYLSPSLKDTLGASANLLTLLLAWFGAWAVAGNIMASRVVSRLGAPRAVFTTLVSMAAGLALWGTGALLLGMSSLPVILFAAALWGVGNFATNSMQQARLVVIAPAIASASIALNTSAIYIGQGAGAALGGHLIDARLLSWLPFAGAAILLVAASASLLAARQRH